MGLYRAKHDILATNRTDRSRTSATELATIRRNEEFYKTTIALLPKDEQAQFKIIPQNPVEAASLATAFATPERYGVIAKSKLMQAAETAAIKSNPRLKTVFSSARDGHAELVAQAEAAQRAHHAKVAAEQAAARRAAAAAPAKPAVIKGKDQHQALNA